MNLTPKAVETLRVLVQRQGAVVSKETLLQEVWPGVFVGESGLTRNICDLRRVLKDFDGGCPIETIPRRGYRFIVSVSEQDNVSQMGRWSVAILPFEAIDHETDPAIAVRVRDAVLSRLARLPSLRVMALHHRIGEAHDLSVPPENDPGADHILCGSLQNCDGQVRLSVRLEDARHGNTIWAERFEESSADPFEAEDALAEEISGALGLLLSTEQPKMLSRRYTESRAAYRDYLRGRFHWNQRSKPEIRQAISHFRRAISEDPDYAPAYSALSSSYSLLPMLSNASPRELMPKARAAAISALAIDESLAEARAALAFVRWHYEWRWKEAEHEYRRILKILPSHAIAHQWYGLLLAEMGRPIEAVEHAARARYLDPSSSIRSNHAMVLFLAGRLNDAEDAARETLALFPESIRARLVLGLVLEQLRRVSEAIRELEELHGRARDVPLVSGALGYAYAEAGRQIDAEQFLGHLQSLPRGRIDFYSRGMVCAGLGDADQAVRAFERACDRREFHLVLLGVDRRLDRLRAVPDFQAILKRIGLVAPPTGG